MSLERSRTDDTDRTSRSLDGVWEFRPDPDDRGVDADWADANADWHATDCHEVEIPHAWQELDDFRDYTGVVWYRRTVDVEDVPAGSQHVLRFGAVDYEATVYVNGVECGGHRGGYLPFEVDATDALTEGENVVTLRVEDPDDISEIPHGKQGDPWYTRVSGPWQGVTLERRPVTRVASTRVTPNLDDDTARVELRVAGVDAVADGGALSVRVAAERDGHVVTEASADLDGDGESDAAATVTLDFEDPDYWHPEDPAIYDLEVSLEDGSDVIDVYDDYFGMRSISHDGDRFYLNGEPLYIRGALDQGYYPKTLYRPFEEGLFEREVETAKELGFNLIRKHIKPAHPDFVELCDRRGLLLWEEPANPASYSERSKREVSEQIDALIERDYNRPSVVIYSLYNEEWGLGHGHDEVFLWEDHEKQEFLGHLYEETREDDPTRLICDNSGWAHVATDINDYHRYFVSPDRADEWARDLDHFTTHPHENYAAEWTDPHETPIVVSEFGSWGLCDVGRLREAYDGNPPWFYHPFLTPEDRDLGPGEVHLESNLRSPYGVDERFAETTLPAMFDDLTDLAETWQWRQYLSMKDVIEQMRTHEGVAGYVITEWTDLEWEFNGILDYLREEKVFHDDFARVNDDLLVSIDAPHVAWAGENLHVGVDVVNDSLVAHDGTLTVAVHDEGGETVISAQVSVEVPASGRVELADTVVLSAPQVEEVERLSIEAQLETDGAEGAAGRTASTDEPLTVAPRTSPAHDGLTVYVQDDHLADRFTGARYTLADRLDDSVDVAVVSEVHDHVGEFIEDGGRVLLLPPHDGWYPRTNLFSYRELPPGENWNLVSSLFAHDSPLLRDLCGSQRLDWAFEGLYPNAVANDLHDTNDDVHVGYVEGWLANWSSPLVTREVGDGVACSCTFPLGERYGEHPVATYLLDHLLVELL